MSIFAINKLNDIRVFKFMEPERICYIPGIPPAITESGINSYRFTGIRATVAITHLNVIETIGNERKGRLAISICKGISTEYIHITI